VICKVWFKFSDGGEETISLEAESIDDVKNLIKQCEDDWLDIGDITIHLLKVAEFKVSENSDDGDSLLDYLIV
jgi:hypothetical protein